MIVKMFKPEFADKVRAGVKLTTIRPVPKIMPRVGDDISLRMWKGKPYRSKQEILGSGEIVSVDMIQLSACFRAVVNNVSLSWDKEWHLAQSDGFDGVNQMMAWFHREHGLPFTGIRITWRKTA